MVRRKKIIENVLKFTFQNGISLEDLLLDPGVLPADGGQVLQDQLGGLRLPGAGLARDDDALVLPRAAHQRVAVVADGEDVGRELADLLLLVELDLLGRVDGQDLVGVHRDQDRTSVGLQGKSLVRKVTPLFLMSWQPLLPIILSFFQPYGTVSSV